MLCFFPKIQLDVSISLCGKLLKESHDNFTTIPDIQETVYGKSILQVPDTGTRVLGNTRPFLRSSIVSFWITPGRFKEHKYHIFRQFWYTKNVPVFTNTGTFQYLGPEVYFFPVYLLWWFFFSLKSTSQHKSTNCL